jgi:hypothetical protein
MLSNDTLNVESLLYHLELRVDVKLSQHHATIHLTSRLFYAEIGDENGCLWSFNN